MRNRKYLAYLLVASLLLFALAGCQNPKEPGDTQPNVPSGSTTLSPDGITQPDTEDPSGSTGTSEKTDSTDDAISTDSQWFAEWWQNYTRHDYGGYSTLYMRELSVWEDGCGFVTTQEWFSWDVATGEIFYPETPYSVTDDFTYTLEGNRLSVTYTKNDHEDYEDFTYIYEIKPSADSMSFVWSNVSIADGEKNTVFVHNSNESIWDLDKGFEVFGIGNSPFKPENPQKPDIPDGTEATTKPAPEDNTPVETNWILGDWTTVIREDRTEGGEARTFVTTVTYGFGANGTGSINDYGWIGRPGEEWEVAGKGFVETYFTYTLEGNTLTITHTGNEFEEYPENQRSVCVYDVVRISDGSISWMPDGGGEDRVYRKVAEDLSVEELLRIFGLKSEAPES